MKRIFALLLCAVLLIGVIAPVSAAVPQEALLTAQEWDVLLLTNRERLRCGLAPVSSTPFLQEACDTRADEIAVLFSHTRPDGSDCFSVLADRSYSDLGENIAAGYPTPANVVEGWMNSPGHRRNILSADFAHMGVGHAYHASGAYGNYWVQLFYTDSDCAYRSMRLAGSAAVSVACKSIDEARLTLALECGCGTCYLPLMQEFCTGFEPGKPGLQTVTVTACGFSAQIDLFVSQDGTVEPPDYSAQTGFRDVSPKAWYAGAVAYAVEQGLMNGVGDKRFKPEESMTRAMLVTVLWRYEGAPEAGTNRFSDVPDGQWYTAAVAWAAENGIVGGVGGGKFEPDGNVTREQIATILFRYAQKTGMASAERGSLSAFPDASSVSGYAREALAWAVAEQIVNGSDGWLLPQGDATRAQVAAILMRYIQSIVE